MARYDPQRSRARPRPDDDAPAPVDALLGATGEGVDETIEPTETEEAVAVERAVEAAQAEELIEQDLAEQDLAEAEDAEAAVETVEATVEATVDLRDQAARDAVNRATALDATYDVATSSPGRARRSPLVGLVFLAALVGALVWWLRRHRRASASAPET